MYPTEVTEEEAEFGFEVRESPTGVRAVVRPLATGLQAVKRVREDGAVEYAICNDLCQPIYPGARSVAELRKRFASR